MSLAQDSVVLGDDGGQVVGEQELSNNSNNEDADGPFPYGNSTQTETEQALGDEIENLKQTVLELNRDLLILEEELLFPANTQVAIFVSMDVGEFFELDSIKVKIDGKLVASHLYTERQINALFRGGVQRLYVGNMRYGSHEITAFFTGKGPSGRDYKRGTTVTIEKGSDPSVVELRIVDSTAKLQPEFQAKEWTL